LEDAQEKHHGQDEGVASTIRRKSEEDVREEDLNRFSTQGPDANQALHPQRGEIVRPIRRFDPQ
jgi:hypothetical protein